MNVKSMLDSAGVKQARQGLSDAQLGVIGRSIQRFLDNHPMPLWVRRLLKVLNGLLIVVNFVYMFFPVDIIPDAPVVGMADDAAVGGLTLGFTAIVTYINAVAMQIARFKKPAQMAMQFLEQEDAKHQAKTAQAPTAPSPKSSPPSSVVKVRIPRT